MKSLKRLHGNPLRTNASINREMAMRCFKAGMTPRQIAAEWPKVFRCIVEHDREVLSQTYDSEYDGDRKETRYTILRESVDAAILKHKGAK